MLESIEGRLRRTRFRRARQHVTNEQLWVFFLQDKLREYRDDASSALRALIRPITASWCHKRSLEGAREFEYYVLRSGPRISRRRAGSSSE
jgi:hypothetical protein